MADDSADQPDTAETEPASKLSAEHTAELADDHAITLEATRTGGIDRIVSAGDDLMYVGWGDGERWVWQLRRGHVARQGGRRKYDWPAGQPTLINRIRDPGDDGPLLVVEGSLQPFAVLSWAPEKWGVYGVEGCWGWANCDLAWASGCDVVVMFDGDVASNRDVHTAAENFAAALAQENVASVRFAIFHATGNKGIDDVLAARRPSDRTEWLEGIVEKASAKLPAKPRAKKDTPKSWGEKIRENYPLACLPGMRVAPYTDGVYRVNVARWNQISAAVMGEGYTKTMRDNTEAYLAGILLHEGLEVREFSTEPLLNCPNGMVDLRTGDLRLHDPALLSGVQIGVPWIPDAVCPTYDLWLAEQAGDQSADLEETASAMLDPTVTPSKAIQLFGPKRSGKSTMIRLLEAIAGDENVSAVTLQDLADNRFASADIYGKILNAAAELRPTDIGDLSLFRKLTGADLIRAERKHGQPFQFTNHALFAFAANELPTIADGPDAYAARIKPFHFNRSFAGAENPALEAAMMGELPGILVRLVAAWQRKHARGTHLPTDPRIMADFEERSNRVLQFVRRRCTIHEADPGQILDDRFTSTKTAIFSAFKTWAAQNETSAMGQQKFIDRLLDIPKVATVRRSSDKGRAINLTVSAPDSDDNYLIREEDHDGGEDPDKSVARVASGSPQPIAYARGLRGGIYIEDKEIVPVTAPPATDTGSDAANQDEAGQSGVVTLPLELPPPVSELPPPDPAPAAGLVPLDLETADSATLHTYGAGFVRLAGYVTGDGSIGMSTDIQTFTDRIAHCDLLTAHNGMDFDLVALARYHGLDLWHLAERGAVADTLLIARQLDPPPARAKGRKTRRYDLDALGERFGLGGKTGSLKDLAKRFGGYDEIPTGDPDYREYLRRDVELQAGVYAALDAQLTDADRAYLYREHKVAALAAQLGLNGFRVDETLLAERVKAGDDRKAATLERIAAEYDVPLTDAKGRRMKSPLATDAGKHALETAFTDMGVLPDHLPRTAKTGKLQTTGEAMTDLALSYAGTPIADPVSLLCSLVAQVTGERTIYHTIAAHTHDGRVNPRVSMDQSTGRWSITSPGLTVIGKRGGRHVEREVLIADEGEVLVTVDYSQVDARAVAVLSGDLAYQAMFAPGLDLHTEIAVRVWGDPKRREDAKPLGHGWNYGMGVARLAEHTGLGVVAAETFDQAMRDQFPRLVEWKREIAAQARTGALLDNGFGRKMRPDPERAHTQGPAFMGQGGARDLMMHGLLNLPAEYHRYLRAVVHDEIVCSVPIGDAEEIEREIVRLMSFPWGDVMIVADAGRRAANWGSCYAKD